MKGQRDLTRTSFRRVNGHAVSRARGGVGSGGLVVVVVVEKKEEEEEEEEEEDGHHIDQGVRACDKIEICAWWARVIDWKGTRAVEVPF